MLAPEHIEDLKKQLSLQIQHLPAEQRKKAQEHIDALSPQALEHLLEHQRNIFRMIIDKDTESVVVGENAAALAVLDINPVSEGHILIIPKSPSQNIQSLPPEIFTLAKELTTKIVQNLKANRVEMQTELKFGEAVLNLIPFYTAPITLASPRKKASLSELKSVASKLAFVPPQRPVIERIKKTTAQAEKILLRRRIP